MNGLSGRKITRSEAASPIDLRYSAWVPERSLTNAIDAPSRDQTGRSFMPGLVVSSVAPPRARSISHSEDSDGDKARTKTACVPSGEIWAMLGWFSGRVAFQESTR